jgi:hypothetical protein
MEIMSEAVTVAKENYLLSTERELLLNTTLLGYEISEFYSKSKCLYMKEYYFCVISIGLIQLHNT